MKTDFMYAGYKTFQNAKEVSLIATSLKNFLILLLMMRLLNDIKILFMAMHHSNGRMIIMIANNESGQVNFTCHNCNVLHEKKFAFIAWFFQHFIICYSKRNDVNL